MGIFDDLKGVDYTIRLIDGFRAYPIYKFSFRWSQDGEWDKERPFWYDGLLEGRVWNSTGFSRMFKEEKTQEWLDKYITDWWGKYVKEQQERGKINNPILERSEARFFEYETWYLTWFQHETFDAGYSDEEVLESFEQFVRRKEELNHKQQRINGEDIYCLMGAEDRWRWRGAESNGSGSGRSPAPCRCKYCKEQGVVRIAH